MTAKKHQPVTLGCASGPCALNEIPPVTTNVLIEVRETGVTTPIDASTVEVTLTALNRKRKLSSDLARTGPDGHLLVTFNAVPEGRYRALAVRKVADRPEASAARNLLVVRLKSNVGGNDPQPVILVLSAKGVARFVFVDDLDHQPLRSAAVIVRHPDGSEQQHVTDASGLVSIPGGSTEVFTVLRVDHPFHGSITATSTEEST